MPRVAPQYQPTFTETDLAHARDVVRRPTSRQDHAIRAHLALLLAVEPQLSNPEAGLRLGLHPNTVRFWRKVWCQGPFRLTDLPGRGRKPHLSPHCGHEYPSRRL